MIVVMCCTRNWYIYLATEIYALFKNNNVKKLYLFIEDDEIPYLKDKRIEFINVNNLPEYITSESPNYNTKYTKLSYLRCYFTKILDCDKIIYVDADAIVINNIEELWNMDVNLIAGVKEPGEWNNHLGMENMDDNYINSGVLIMNLANIRKQHIDDEMIKLLNTNKYYFPDQDVINIAFKEKTYLSNMYNSTETTGFRDDAKIIHYIRERKGWIKESPRSEIWYNFHNEMIGGNKMENYKVIAKINFNDYEGKDINNSNNSFVERIAGKSEWWCSAERYQYLKEHNAVELIEIEKVDLPKVEPLTDNKEPEVFVGYTQVIKESTKPKATFKKKTSKK